MTQKNPKNRKFQRIQHKQKAMGGATLIEVLVAVLILSFGLLGMSALQIRAMKGGISSFQRTQAVIFSQYLMDVMRVDREAAKGGNYNIVLTCDPNGFSTTTLAQNTLKQWLISVKTNIGTVDDTKTCAVVTCDGEYVCMVRVQWDDSRMNGLPTQSIEVSSRV